MQNIQKIQNVLETLPLSYYLKRGEVKTVLSNTATTSTYNLETDTITISISQLSEMLQDSLSDNDMEEQIRNVLYHEVSHALLTPKELKRWNNKDIVNVFEDERVESLLRNYYMRVNFRQGIKKANHYPSNCIKTATDPFSAFYCIVRFREGPKKFLREVHEIITKNASLRPVFNNENVKQKGSIPVNDLVRQYVDDINKFYKEVEDWFNNECKDKKNKEQSKYTSMNESYQEEDDDNKEGLSGSETDENPDIKMPQTETDSEELCLTPEEEFEVYLGTRTLEDFLDDFSVQKTALKDKIQYLIENYNKANKKNGSAIPTHHGRLDKRSIQKAQKNLDYKYWITRNRLGNLKAYSKLHLNIFCDVSGSMRESQEVVNRMLMNLLYIEKEVPSFSFDLITMSEGEWIEPKDNRQVRILEQKRPIGNFLDENIFEVFKKVQLPDSNNYNIVLFDGDYISGPYTKKDHENKEVQNNNRKNLSAFNNNKTIVISDDSNKKYCDQFLNNNYIITKEYTKELEKEIINALNKMLK